MSDALNQADALAFSEAGASARRWEVPLLSFGQNVEDQRPPPTAAEIEAIEAAAHADGYARGLAEGRAEGRRQGAAAIAEEAQRLRQLIAHLAQPLADLDGDVERTLVALTIEVARRLVDEQLQLDPGLTAAAVRTAIASLSPPPREVRVHLHPDDASLLQDLPAPPDVTSWRLVPDAGLRRGDVCLVTENAVVDALLDTRQAGVARALMGEGE